MTAIFRHIINFLKKIYHHRLIYFWLHPIISVLWQTILGYSKHGLSHLGAALAYYTIFSLPAIIIIIVGLVGFFLGEAAVQGEVYANIVDFVGKESAAQIENAVKNIGTTDTNFWATVFGVSVLVFVATGVFYALQETLNTIFEVKEILHKKKVKVLHYIINRLLSLAMVLSIGALLMLSIILNTILRYVSDYIITNEAFIVSKIPPKFKFLTTYLDYFTDYFLVFLNSGLSIFLIAFFFAMLYRILPAVKLSWGYVWAGALFSALLFWFGEILMAIYLSKASVISAYGAAGSLIVVLIWVYYSSQLIFLGAEFIRALASYRNYAIVPKSFATRLHQIKKRKKKNTTPVENTIEESTIPIVSPIDNTSNDCLPEERTESDNME